MLPDKSKQKVQIKREPGHQISKFREKFGMLPIGQDKNTVALVEIDGKSFLGVNSKVVKANGEVFQNSLDLRKQTLKEIQDNMGLFQGKHLGHARFLNHAEAHSLIRAKQRFGILPKEVTIYVDRKTCGLG